MIAHKPCPSCGLITDCDVTSNPRGGVIEVFLATPHKASCGLPCAAGRDVSIGMAMSGKAHSNNKCPACPKEGRGYPRPDEQP